MIISLLTDFAEEDGWIAACKGRILSIAPNARFLDISHNIPAFNIKKGALVLASTLAFLPIGIHVAIIDPGVGGERRGIIAETQRGDFLVGPDNGILSLAIEKLGGARKVVEIKNHQFLPEEICPTFHGRDVFSPAAAFILKGISIGQFGPIIDPEELAKKPWNDPLVEEGRIVGEVIDIDRFGTIRSNISAALLEKEKILKNNMIQSQWGPELSETRLVETFDQVARGEKLLLVDSSGFLSMAINYGNAAMELTCQVGDVVVIQK